jgi:hypothetical protein|eukprot:TRINITY_DN20_c0_g1_i1.p1 TRINITY_DN20_c0_g1~~TRINITY_DN20_c0_g1_i1.p1  ORF type:complete len:274 (-),score=49.39 TRINITY_DN20_c0_g1_i1:243-1040(-)
MAANTANVDTVKLPNGNELGLLKPSTVDDATWSQVKQWLASNPDKAVLMQKSVKEMTENPAKVDAFRGVLALAESMKNDPAVPVKLESLATDPKFAAAFQEMKTGGMDAVMKYYNDEGFLRAVSQKMGGVPKEMQTAMATIHDNIRAGDLAAVQKHLSYGVSPDTKDAAGISALHFAVGVNRLDILKALMDAKADPKVVDNQGNSVLHYAAGYGHVQTTEYFLQCGLPINATNNAGETPLDLAVRNNHAAVVATLKSRGAQTGKR